MAKRVIEILEDDLGDGDAAGTLRFGLDGTWYEIDLSERNTERFHKSMKEYVENARRTGGKAGGAAKKTTPAKKAAAASAPIGGDGVGANGANSSGYSNREIRDWARTQGLDVKAQGKLPSELIEQFVAARNKTDKSAEPVAV